MQKIIIKRNRILTTLVNDVPYKVMYSLFVPCFGNSLFVMTLGTQCLRKHYTLSYTI